jgi:hypothetical protein
MIAYNKTWLANLRLQETVKADLQKGYINDTEFKAIKEKYPVGFYTPSQFFARVGLFILTCVVVLFADGLLALMANSSHVITSPGFPIFLGLASYVTLEVMAGVKNHYRSGVDDALLFISGCLFTAGFSMMLLDHNDDLNYTAISGIVFVLSLLFTIRFADMLMSAVCCASFFALIFFGWTRVIPAGLTTVPFIIMLISAGTYWLIYANRSKYINYENSFIIGQIVCLLTLYAAGNYYIVQTLSYELNGQAGKAIPFRAIFWAWTISLPFVYLGFGIRKKDIIVLRTGLLLIAAAVVTFRNYYHILPIDTTLTIGGAVILSIAYGIMEYLKTPKYSFTYAGPDEAHLMDHVKVESLIVAETFSTAPSVPNNDGVKFGGGDFGGGGSSGTF